MTAPTAQKTRRNLGTYCITTISAFAIATLVVPAGIAHAEPVAIGLGTATSFAVLAGAGITNTGPTTLGGDIGTYPTPTVTGTAELTLTGTNNADNAVSRDAKPDALTAYNTLAGQKPPTRTDADLTGQTLVSGVYNSGSSIALSGTVTLDAEGDPDAVFVFQAGSTLITSSSSTVALINGTQACNVFWQIGSSATLGTNSVFRGNLLALTDITATTRATVEGRLIAINGAVTLDTNTVTIPNCAPPVTTTNTAAAPTTTTSSATTTVAAPADTTTTAATSTTSTTSTAPADTTTTAATSTTSTTSTAPADTTTTAATSTTSTTSTAPADTTTTAATSTTTTAPADTTTTAATSTTTTAPADTTTTAATSTTTTAPPTITTSRNLPQIVVIPVLPALPALPGGLPLSPESAGGTSPLPSTSVSGVPTSSVPRVTTTAPMPGIPESSDSRTSQVRQIPRGSVDTGDGSTHATPSSALDRAWIPVILVFLAAAVLVARRTSR